MKNRKLKIGTMVLCHGMIMQINGYKRQFQEYELGDAFLNTCAEREETFIVIPDKQPFFKVSPVNTHNPQS